MATATAAPYPDRASSALAGYLPAFQGHEAEPCITLHPVSNAPGQVRVLQSIQLYPDLKHAH